jgi:hypothetical protein
VTKKNTTIYIVLTLIFFLVQAGRIAGQELPVDTVAVIPVAADTVDFFSITGDTVAVISAAPLEEEPEKVHSPHKAAIYSAILPGLGQAYNKKYWKIPLVYGGFAAFGYFIGFNNNNYQVSKNAYRDLTDGDDSTTSYLKLKQIEYYNLDNPSDVERLKHGLLRRQDYFRRNRDLLVILTIGFYGLNIIDASVDAHFFNWDISDDLTLRWQPTLDQFHNKNIYSLNCSIRF